MKAVVAEKVTMLQHTLFSPDTFYPLFHTNLICTHKYTLQKIVIKSQRLQNPILKVTILIYFDLLNQVAC